MTLLRRIWLRLRSFAGQDRLDPLICLREE